MKIPTQKEVIEFAQTQSTCRLSMREKMLLYVAYNWLVKQIKKSDRIEGIDYDEIGTDWNNGEFYKD